MDQNEKAAAIRRMAQELQGLPMPEAAVFLAEFVGAAIGSQYYAAGVAIDRAQTTCRMIGDVAAEEVRLGCAAQRSRAV
jgi:uncharacterized protein (DUF2164 family)